MDAANRIHRAMKSDWTTLLAQAMTGVDKVPKGWKTADQIAEETGQHETAIRKKLKTLLKLGKVEVPKKFRVKCQERIQTVAHWKMK